MIQEQGPEPLSGPRPSSTMYLKDNGATTIAEVSSVVLESLRNLGLEDQGPEVVRALWQAHMEPYPVAEREVVEVAVAASQAHPEGMWKPSVLDALVRLAGVDPATAAVMRLRLNNSLNPNLLAALDKYLQLENVDSQIGLTFEGLDEWAAWADSTPHPGWLVERVWPADAYGVLAAPAKAGKTWAALDLAASIAVGHRWFGLIPCPPGKVLYLVGEGGKREIVRRLRAIADQKGVQFHTVAENIRLLDRSIRLTDPGDLGGLEVALADQAARCVIVDPLYLAAGPVQGSSIYDMGSVLAPVQQIAQDAGAALVIVHHYNKSGSGKGVERMSGAGVLEWPRVTIAGDPQPIRDGHLRVTWNFAGGVIAPATVETTTRVSASDPLDLTSAMSYGVEARWIAEESESGVAALTGAASEVHAALASGGADAQPRSCTAIGDLVTERMSARGASRAGYAPRTIQLACKDLAEAGIAVRVEGSQAQGFLYSLAPDSEPEEAQ